MSTETESTPTPSTSHDELGAAASAVGSADRRATDLRAEPEAPPATGAGAFRQVPRTGVIYVSEEARKRGFHMDAEGWCNLGQGQPETGPLVGAPPRVTNVPVLSSDLDYAPVAGLWELREAVAGLYNRLFRRGMPSQYSAENVAISGGGRVGVMRACATIAPVHLGHFLPDYTAYEELLDVFRRFQPIPLQLDPARGYEYTSADLRRDILGLGLGAVLMSNPCNPTGKAIRGDTLAAFVGAARSLGAALIFDEFYSHYIWAEPEASASDPAERIVSAARYVEDVDRDPVLIIDGLTKNWRYPGFRVAWIVGPKKVIESAASAGSFLDGGGTAPMQRAAIDLITPEQTLAETAAIQETFRRKRDWLIARLRALGVRFDIEPEGTFYAWGDVRDLPAPMNTADGFFHEMLDRQVITVPGHFFDVNPGKRRMGRPSRFRHHVRFSYGPELAVLEQAVERVADAIAAHRP